MNLHNQGACHVSGAVSMLTSAQTPLPVQAALGDGAAHGRNLKLSNVKTMCPKRLTCRKPRTCAPRATLLPAIWRSCVPPTDHASMRPKPKYCTEDGRSKRSTADRRSVRVSDVEPR